MPDFIFANNASSVLASPLSSVGTTLLLAAGTGARFPNPIQYSEQFTLTLKNPTTGEVEIVYVQERIDDTVNVIRAQEGTIAISFPANAGVVHTLTAAVLEFLRDL